MTNRLLAAKIAFGVGLATAAIGTTYLASPKFTTPTASLNLPERPPSFEELISLAAKNKAPESIIESYFHSVPKGEGAKKVIALAEQGDLTAITLACATLKTGLGGVTDIPKSTAFCKTAAAAGKTASQANLIYRNFNKHPETGNWQETHDAFTDLMKTAPSRAHQGLQYLYKQNHPKGSYRLMERHALEAIKLDNTRSMFGLAMIDLRGPEQVQNFERAERNFKRAYELYDFDSGLALAREYRNGDKLEKDEATYVAMVKRMAMFRHLDSMSELAYMYDTGRGVEQDTAKASVLHAEAAELGSPFSQEMTGYRLIKNTQNLRDVKKGIIYLEASANRGKIDAMRALSKLYAREDIGDPKNNKTKWLAMAALHGDEHSQELLGFGYMETGYIKEMRPYIEVLELAHKSGNPNASYLLARHFRAASGVKRDIRKAKRILKSAESSGHPRIAEELEIIDGYIEFFGGIDSIPAIIKRNG